MTKCFKHQSFWHFFTHCLFIVTHNISVTLGTLCTALGGVITLVQEDLDEFIDILSEGNGDVMEVHSQEFLLDMPGTFYILKLEGRVSLEKVSLC